MTGDRVSANSEQARIYGKDIPVTKATADVPPDLDALLADLSIELPGDRDAFLQAMTYWRDRAERAEAIVDSYIETAVRYKDGRFPVKVGCDCRSCARNQLLQEYVDARP